MSGIFATLKKETKNICIGNIEYKVCFVADFDTIFEIKTEKELSATCPFGGVIWPSSVALCNWISDLQSSSHPDHEVYREIVACLADPSAKILELGCGVGLTSTYLAKLLQRKALLTDFEDSLFEIVQQNARNFGVMDFVTTASLDWRSESLPDAIAGQNIRLIVATDVLYEHEHIKRVPAVAKRIMKVTGAKLFLLADPERYCYQSALGELYKTFDEVSRFTYNLKESEVPLPLVRLHLCRLTQYPDARTV